MALDREKALGNAEQLLKQGKVQAALQALPELDVLDARHLVALNRVGDLLARGGHSKEAFRCYEKIASHFTQGGFVPKAIAIYKKLLKLDPRRAETLHKLGELYLNQQHTNEARNYLLKAGERYLGVQDFDSAGGVYQKLAELEPGNVFHRVRLAEVRAAKGETGPAGEDLIAVGESLLESSRPEDAEKAYQRAANLLPDRLEPLCGWAFSLSAQDLHDDAIRTLEENLGDRREQPVARAALAVVYDLGSRDGDAGKLLGKSPSHEVAGLYVENLLRYGRAEGRIETAWSRLDSFLEEWGPTDETLKLLDRLAGLEEKGHLPALERLLKIRREQGNRGEVARVLERLVEVSKATSKEEEADRWSRELASEGSEPEPPTPKAAEEEPPKAAEKEAPPQQVAEKPAKKAQEKQKEKQTKRARKKEKKKWAAKEDSGASTAQQPAMDGAASVEEAETPAVPLSAGDEEFVGGHLTEAEVLQKYGLAGEALERLRAVTARFPGHVEAQRRLVALVREHGDRSALQEALLQFSLALRAAGDAEEAHSSVREAAELAPLSRERVDLLRKLDLFDEGLHQPASPEPVEPEQKAPEPAPAKEPASAHAATPAPVRGREEVEILFEDSGGPDPAPAEKTVPGGERVPPADVLEEIAFYHEQGMHPEALQKLEALKTLGYSGKEVDALEAAVRKASGLEKKAAPAPEPPRPAPASDPSLRLDDDDLSGITAALEAELSEELEAPAPTPEAGEESLEAIFDAFKQHVEKEVGSDDHRTHYDLGIAYKEMGLVKDALQAFEIATRSPEIFMDACSMLALCQREQGNIEEAIRWYQKALEEPGGSDEERQGLSYDLAEVLLQQGDTQAALDLFRHILDADPGYRDVQDRVSELQTILGA